MELYQLVAHEDPPNQAINVVEAHRQAAATTNKNRHLTKNLNLLPPVKTKKTINFSKTDVIHLRGKGIKAVGVRREAQLRIIIDIISAATVTGNIGIQEIIWRNDRGRDRVVVIEVP